MKTGDALKVTLAALVDVMKTDERMGDYRPGLVEWASVMGGGGPTSVYLDSIVFQALTMFCTQPGNY